MDDSSAPGELVRRLLAHRGLDAPVLTEAGGPGGLAAPGGPGPALADLEPLAPALGLHLPDLCVIAGIPVPEELAPLDDQAGYEVASLLYAAALLLPPPSLEPLLAQARTLPQHDRTRPFPAPKPYEDYPPGFGGAVLGMMRNRNLRMSFAVGALQLFGGPYWATSMLMRVGRGQRELAPGPLAGFAAVLGMDAADLAAMGGIELPAQGPPVHPSAPQLAELLWETRRLTAGQVESLAGRWDPRRR